MSQLDAITLSKTVKRRLVNFALDNHFIQDPQLRRACQALWSGSPQEGGLLSDLWIEGAFPAKPSQETLHTLAQQGQFDADLCDHQKCARRRPPSFMRGGIVSCTHGDVGEGK